MGLGGAPVLAGLDAAAVADDESDELCSCWVASATTHPQRLTFGSAKQRPQVGVFEGFDDDVVGDWSGADLLANRHGTVAVEEALSVDGDHDRRSATVARAARLAQQRCDRCVEQTLLVSTSMRVASDISAAVGAIQTIGFGDQMAPQLVDGCLVARQTDAGNTRWRCAPRRSALFALAVILRFDLVGVELPVQPVVFDLSSPIGRDAAHLLDETPISQRSRTGPVRIAERIEMCTGHLARRPLLPHPLDLVSNHGPTDATPTLSTSRVITSSHQQTRRLAVIATHRIDPSRKKQRLAHVEPPPTPRQQTQAFDLTRRFDQTNYPVGQMPNRVDSLDVFAIACR